MNFQPIWLSYENSKNIFGMLGIWVSFIAKCKRHLWRNAGILKTWLCLFNGPNNFIKTLSNHLLLNEIRRTRHFPDPAAHIMVWNEEQIIHLTYLSINLLWKSDRNVSLMNPLPWKSNNIRVYIKFVLQLKPHPM